MPAAPVPIEGNPLPEAFRGADRAICVPQVEPIGDRRGDAVVFILLGDPARDRRDSGPSPRRPIR